MTSVLILIINFIWSEKKSLKLATKQLKMNLRQFWRKKNATRKRKPIPIKKKKVCCLHWRLHADKNPGEIHSPQTTTPTNTPFKATVIIGTNLWEREIARVSWESERVNVLLLLTWERVQVRSVNPSQKNYLETCSHFKSLRVRVCVCVSVCVEKVWVGILALTQRVCWICECCQRCCFAYVRNRVSLWLQQDCSNDQARQ